MYRKKRIPRIACDVGLASSVDAYQATKNDFNVDEQCKLACKGMDLNCLPFFPLGVEMLAIYVLHHRLQKRDF